MEAAGEMWLADGDTILIASRTLQFRERATQGRPADILNAVQQAERPESKKPAPVPPDEPLRPIPKAAYTEPARPPLTSVEAGAVARTATDAIPSEVAGTRLCCLDGPCAGQLFDLLPRPMSIGRASDRDIPLTADESLSRNHATIGLDSGRHTIQDEGSANGTFINEIPLPPRQPRALRAGDYIRLGRTIMRYE
jgi:pSer/pThr/pTyr-binding forkhead associated (FHA) protein